MAYVTVQQGSAVIHNLNVLAFCRFLSAVVEHLDWCMSRPLTG